MYNVEIRSKYFDSFTHITQEKHAYQALVSAISTLHIRLEKEEKSKRPVNISFEVIIKEKQE